MQKHIVLAGVLVVSTLMGLPGLVSAGGCGVQKAGVCAFECPSELNDVSTAAANDAWAVASHVEATAGCDGAQAANCASGWGWGGTNCSAQGAGTYGAGSCAINGWPPSYVSGGCTANARPCNDLLQTRSVLRLCDVVSVETMNPSFVKFNIAPDGTGAGLTCDSHGGCTEFVPMCLVDDEQLMCAFGLTQDQLTARFAAASAAHRAFAGVA